MILNQYLPREELESTLSKKEFKNLEFILQNILPEEQRINSIFTELELLGKIHHIVNLSKYNSKKFRRDLFQSSMSIIKHKWDEYFKKCNVKKQISVMVELEGNIKKNIEFDWGDNERTKLFVEFFNYPEYMVPINSPKIKSTEIIYGQYAKFDPLKILFEYQTPIVTKTLKYIKRLNERCLIQMPTGTGKTRTIMEVLVKILNQEKNVQVIWLANKSELLEQARDSFIHVWNHVGTYPINAIAMWGSSTVQEIPREKVIIFAGYEKLNNLLNSQINPKPHYVIVDEAHQILAPMYNNVLNKLVNFENSTRVIGLTATPGRGIDEQQNNLLVDQFYGNIIQIELENDDEEYGKNIVRYLEDQDILARVKLEPLYTDYEYNLSEEEWTELTHLVEGDRSEYKEMLKKLADDNVRNMLIINKLAEYANQDKKILYFSTSKSQSIIIFAALQQLGINAIHVDDETEPSFRRQIIKKFIETNEINVICNYNIFSTGFDVPKLDVVFIGRPINSPVLFNQMVGRGTRGIKMGSDSDSFILVQVIDKIKSRFTNFDPYEQYGFWDSNWKDKQN